LRIDEWLIAVAWLMVAAEMRCLLRLRAFVPAVLAVQPDWRNGGSRAAESLAAGADRLCAASVRPVSPKHTHTPRVALGLAVRELRQELDLTQEALGRQADIHWTYIGGIERGERNLPGKTL
jgi:DNA-binding XRE family transcriptional regulator